MKRAMIFLMAMGVGMASQAATIVPISSITGHHQGDGTAQDDVNGGIVRVINGVGITKPDADDPTTWTHNTGWTDGWQGQQIGTLTLNQGWVVLDVGAAHPPLGYLHAWNVNEGTSSIDRGVQTYQIYVSDAPTVTPPLPGGTALDYDFSSGGWTAFGGVQTLPIGLGNAPLPVSDSIPLSGIQAQYIGIEFITNYGNTSPGRTGLAELALTALEPAISPADTVFAGTAVSLTIEAGGTNPTYQWYKDSVLLGGETGATLSIASAVVADSGDYTVEVTTVELGTVTSLPVTLTVNAASTPVFTENPADATRYPGGPVSFSAAVDGTPPFAYQWAFNGTPIPGETAATLALDAVTPADGGSYTLIASNPVGQTTSAPGVLTVRIPPAGSYEEGVVTSGPIGYWRMEEPTGSPTAFDFVSGYDGTHVGGAFAGLAGPRPGDFDGMPAANNAVNYNGTDSGTTTGKSLMSNLSQFTMMGFINPTTLPNARVGFMGQNDVTEFGLHGADFAIWTPGGGYFAVSPTNLLLNTWNHIAATGDGTALRFYVNGVEILPSQPGVTTNYGASAFAFNIGYAILDGTGNFFNGAFDEVALFDRALDRPEINGIYNLSQGLVSPTIIDQPVDQELVLGDLNEDITFFVQGSGTQPLSYQWKYGGVDIPGATNDTLVISNAVPADAGTYTVAVTNPGDTLLSDPATLTVVSGPVTPAAITTLEGDTASYTVTMPADSTGYIYQWSDGSGAIADATNATLDVPGVTAGSETYTVEVTLGPDTVTSDPVALTVLALATDAYNNLITAAGPLAYWRLGEATGSVVAVDQMGSFDADILSNTVLAVSGALVGDADTAMEFPGTSKVELFDPFGLMTDQFTVEFWALSSGGSGFRSPITCRDLDATSGQRWGWTFYANGSNQWQFDSYDGTVGPWNSIVGPAVAQGQWTHVVGTYDGTDMNLYVNGSLAGTVANAPYVLNDLTPLWIGSGATEAGSGQAGSFPWAGKVDEVAIYDRALSLTEVQEHFAASYGVATAPEINLDPQFTWVRVGEPVSLPVGARGLPLLTYQWQKDGVDIPGATGLTLELAAATADDSGMYKCTVSNPNGSVASAEGELYVLADLGGGVSVNFWDNRDADPAVGEAQRLTAADVAGYMPLGNWNNAVTTGNDASGDGAQPIIPIDQDGNATSMDVRWSSQASWRAGPGPVGGTTDERLAYGYLDDGDTPDPALDANNNQGGVAGDGIGISITVSNIPYANYIVALYLNSDQGGGTFGNYTVNGVTQTGGPTQDYGEYGGWVPDQNVLMYFNNAASTLEIRVAPRDGTTRTSLAGFQILDAESAVAPSIPVSAFSIDPTGGTYSITWDSIVGTEYKVESESDLVNGPWAEEAGSTVTATDDSTTHTGPATADNANYRVVETP